MLRNVEKSIAGATVIVYHSQCLVIWGVREAKGKFEVPVSSLVGCGTCNQNFGMFGSLTEHNKYKIPWIFSSLVFPLLISFAPTPTIYFLGAKCPTWEAEEFFELLNTHLKESKLEKLFETEKKTSWRNLGTWASVKEGESDGIELDWRTWTELKLTSVFSRLFIGTNSEEQQLNYKNWSC